MNFTPSDSFDDAPSSLSLIFRIRYKVIKMNFTSHLEFLSM